MSELIKEIEKRLKDLYPHIVIRVDEHSNIRSVIFCNNKKVTEFNPQILQSELSYFSERPDYLDLFVQAIKPAIDRYSRLLNATVSRGLGSKGISLQKINEAIINTKSCSAAAKFLHVTYKTFKKYASLYKDENGVSLFEKHKNEKGTGIPKMFTSQNMGRFSLDDIIEGKASDNYPIWKFKQRLIKNGYIKEKCAICGFSERRISDYKIPLELDFIDGNALNKSLENVRLLCYNCYYLNVGNLAWRRHPRRKIN